MSETAIRLLFLSHLAATLYLVGLIWVVQVVHYPLMARVAPADFPAFESEHQRLIFRVVAGPMLLEGTTACLLTQFPPPQINSVWLWSGVFLMGVIWWSTVCLQVPCHQALAKEFHPEIHQRLVFTNWLRTAAWTLRGSLVVWMTWVTLS